MKNFLNSISITDRTTHKIIKENANRQAGTKGYFAGYPELERIYRDALKYDKSTDIYAKYSRLRNRINPNVLANYQKHRKYKGMSCNFTVDEFAFWFYNIQDSYRMPLDNIDPDLCKSFEYQIDKDILPISRGEEVDGYYLENLVFIPKYLNSMMEKRDSIRSKTNLPLGVATGRNGAYSVYVSIWGKSSHILVVRTIRDKNKAYWLYKFVKDSIVRRMAFGFYRRDLITREVFEALLKIKVKDDSGRVDYTNAKEDKKWAWWYLYQNDIFAKIHALMDEYTEPMLDKMSKSVVTYGLSKGTTHTYNMYSRIPYYELDPIGSKVHIKEMELKALDEDSNLFRKSLVWNSMPTTHKPTLEAIQKIESGEFVFRDLLNPKNFDQNQDDKCRIICVLRKK